MLKTTDRGAKNFRGSIQGESGSALLASFMVIALIAGAGLTAVTTSSVNAKKANNVTGSKQALYIAEAALNHGKMALHQKIANWDSYATYTTPYTLIPTTSFAGVGTYTVTIKGANPSVVGGPLLMTATGTLTDNTNTGQASLADRTKTITTLLTLDNANLLGNAFITGKDLLVSGNPVFSGTSGGIHANDDLTISGNPTIATNAQANDRYTVTGTPTVGGFSGGGQPKQTINPLRAWNIAWGNYDYYFAWTYYYYDAATNTYNYYYDPVTGTYTYYGVVYDRNGIEIARVAPGGTWNCWQYTSYTYWYNTTTGLYEYTPFIWTMNCPTSNGTYLVLGDAVIAANAGTVASPWITTILAYGSIKVTAPNLVARPPAQATEPTLYRSQTKNLLFVADMDVQISGTINQKFGYVDPVTNVVYGAITSAYQQVGISGDPNYYGYILAQDVGNTKTYYYGTNFVADDNYISGNMKLTYNGDVATGTQGNAVPQATLY